MRLTLFFELDRTARLPVITLACMGSLLRHFSGDEMWMMECFFGAKHWRHAAVGCGKNGSPFQLRALRENLIEFRFDGQRIRAAYALSQ